MRGCLLILATLALSNFTPPAEAQNRPYTEGTVTNISYIRVKPGMFDKYMKWLSTDWKRNLEAQKKEGIVLNYAVYTSPQTREDDWNMMLAVTYKNMAALDNLRDRTEPVTTRVLSSTPEQLAQGNAERGALRDQLGNRLVRELILR